MNKKIYTSLSVKDVDDVLNSIADTVGIKGNINYSCRLNLDSIRISILDRDGVLRDVGKIANTYGKYAVLQIANDSYVLYGFKVNMNFNYKSVILNIDSRLCLKMEDVFECIRFIDNDVVTKALNKASETINNHTDSLDSERFSASFKE